MPIETFNRYLAAHSSYLHHNGRAFALKPMVLFRLDLSELVSEPELLRTEVQVHEQQKVHRIKVAFPVELVAPYQNGTLLFSPDNGKEGSPGLSKNNKQLELTG